jgi:hypothetical protein
MLHFGQRLITGNKQIVKAVWFDKLPPDPRKKSHIPQRASQGRRSTGVDRVEYTSQQVSVMFLCHLI